MTKNDPPLIVPADIGEALALLSRIPWRTGEPRGGNAAWAYPVAGLALGLIAGVAGSAALWLGLSSSIAALVTLASIIALTGAMHEDGLADSLDGLWGGWDRPRRLEIMKDSHIGSYGVIGLCISLLARWVAIWALFDWGAGIALPAIIAAACLSRAAMPLLMWRLPHARSAGLSQSVGSVQARTALTGALIAGIAALLLLGAGAILAAALALLVAGAAGWIARTKIGGQTGDILGATQQLTEIAVLITLMPQAGSVFT